MSVNRSSLRSPPAMPPPASCTAAFSQSDERVAFHSSSLCGSLSLPARQSDLGPSLLRSRFPARLGGLCETVPQSADSFDLQLDDVAGTQLAIKLQSAPETHGATPDDLPGHDDLV